ncbi:MAG: 2-C-methyl-D-erythritol 4-phosphate cytidylyltransferase [Pseudohongiellaceae bacterium]|jgi:2-C-methyl-D-erythritol 4-phosphate cytidylyltransferase
MGATIPKQYLQLNGLTVIEHSLKLLSSLPQLEQITVVVHPDDEHWQKLESGCFVREIVTVVGGDERGQSVMNGLLSINAGPDDWVLVHDAVRPCASLADIQQLIKEVTESADYCHGAILATPISSTIKRVNQANEIEGTVERERLWSALTPQLFPLKKLIQAMESALAQGLLITDEASAMEHFGYSVKVVPGSSHNIKITHPADLALAELILKSQEITQ